MGWTQNEKMDLVFCYFFGGCSFAVISSESASVADYALFCPYREQSDLPAPSQVDAMRFSPQEIDLRSADLTSFDFSSYSAAFANHLIFDSKTKWPVKSKLAKEFDPTFILQRGKNPGLQVHALHTQGITGAGVSIAIIDQPLLTTHQEYADRIALYESRDPLGNEASMHGSAVTSIAAGKTVGVAPEAKIYYLSAVFHENKEGHFDARPITQALKRLYQINKKLPAQEKIRVVSISRGFDKQDLGAEKFTKMRQKLEKSGVAVLTTDSALFTVSRRNAFADPEDNASYTRAAYWFFKKNNVPHYEGMSYILFPTDYRTTASPTGIGDYVFYTNGGLSWAVPYAAGLYALGAQVYPSLTPELFWDILRETAVPTRVESPDGKYYVARYLVQPAAFINKLQRLSEK